MSEKRKESTIVVQKISKLSERVIKLLTGNISRSYYSSERNGKLAVIKVSSREVYLPGKRKI